jgi:uncharacterized repeat protein (TIGR02543 family)
MVRNRKLFLWLFILFLVVEIGLLILLGLSTKKLENYTVSFEANGGEVVRPITVKEGSKLDPTFISEKYGYDFDGWYLDASFDHLYNYLEGVYSNFTLYAKWRLIPGFITHTITWQDFDGRTLEVDLEVFHDTLPEYNSIIPTRAPSAQYLYYFIGWSPKIELATDDATYVAQYSTVLQKYHVIWQNEDGKILEVEDNIAYGTVPSYSGITPTKAPTAQYEYTFDGWTDPILPITSDVTYTAHYNSSLRKYNVTWIIDGVAQTDYDLPYGTLPSAPFVPTKTPTAEFQYTFNGWNPQVTNVVGHAVYEATYLAQVRSYTVIWLEWDGTTLLTNYGVPYGTFPDPTIAVNPVHPSQTSDPYTYVFAGWSPQLSTVVENVTYTATYTPVIKTFNVSWQIDSLVLLSVSNVAFGTNITYADYTGATPTKDATVSTVYTFSGWAEAEGPLYADRVYHAVFTSAIRQYVVTWLNWDASVIDSDSYNYNTLPNIPATVTRDQDAQYTYSFSGWSPTVGNVTADQTYLAQFTSTLRTYLIVFDNYNGDTLYDYQANYGTMATYAGPTPIKPSTAQYDYVFSGWFPALSIVTSDFNRTAQYVSILRSYTVTWKNYDGSTLLINYNVPYNTAFNYPNSNPVRPDSVQYSYTFVGWDLNGDSVADILGNVTGNATLTAIYNLTEHFFNVSWYVLDWVTEDYVLYNTGTTYDGLAYGTSIGAPFVPIQVSSVSTIYDFVGWSPAVHTVDGNNVYYALYDSQLKSYSITWVVTGLSNQSTLALWGTLPSYATVNINRPSVAQYDFIFTGWSPALHVVNGSTLYTAQFTDVTRHYNVTWNNWDNSNILTNYNVAYGTLLNYQGQTPTRPSSSTQDYTFIGWDLNADGAVDNLSSATVNGNVTLKAIYSASDRYYTILWNNWDGYLLSTTSYIYGDTPSYDSTTPTKSATTIYTYTFSGWSPSVSAVSGDQIYVAQFTQNLAQYAVTFKNWDDTVLQAATLYTYGTIPSYSGSTPTKAAIASGTYTFSGWSPAVSVVVGATTYVAQFAFHAFTYTVAFENFDGTLLLTIYNVPHGTALTYNGVAPTKDPAGSLLYNFIGWDGDADDQVDDDYIITGNTTYVAVFEEAPAPLSVTFINTFNGEIISIESTTYGEDVDGPQSLSNLPEYEYLVAWNVDPSFAYDPSYDYVGNDIDLFLIENVVTNLTVYTIYSSVFLYQEAFGTAEIVGYIDTGRYVDIEVPSIIDGFNISSIASNVFVNTTTPINSITIPNAIPFIANGALSGLNDLTKVTLPFIGTSAINVPLVAFAKIFASTSGSGLYSNGAGNYLPETLKEAVITGGTIVPEAAFQDLKLEKVTLPEGIEIISENAFQYCFDLTTINIPNSVFQIGIRAFASCYALDNVSLNPATVLYIADYAFSSCIALTNLTLGVNVSSIGDGTFEGCVSLVDVALPSGLSSIGALAFAGCSSLTSIVIPQSIYAVGASAFANCTSLVSVDLGGLYTVNQATFFGDTSLQNVYFNSVVVIQDYAFANCTSLISLVLSETLTDIEEYAFVGCTSLISVTFFDSLEDIGVGVFKNCSSLISLVIPDNVVYIGEQIFSGASSLVSLTVPFIGGGESSVEPFGYYFGETTYAGSYLADTYYIPLTLTTVVVTGSGSIPTEAFLDFTSLVTVILHTNAEIGASAFLGCSSLVNVNLGNATIIGDYAFSANTSLVSLIIPDSTTNIGSNAFSGCTNLTNLYLGDSLEVIGEFAFAANASLLSVVLPASLINLGASAFQNDSSLNSVTFQGNNLAVIGMEAFKYCSSLTSLVIPNSVVSIGYQIFYGATSLVSLTMAKIYEINGNEYLGNMFGQYMSALTYEDDFQGNYYPYTFTTLVITNATYIPAYAMTGCLYLTSVTLNEGVNWIGEGAFRWCIGLLSLTLPNSVHTIYSLAFEGCYNLAQLNLGNSLEEIYYHAFRSCSSLVSLVIPDSVTYIGGDILVGASLLQYFTTPLTDGVNRLGLFFGLEWYSYAYNADSFYIPMNLTTLVISSVYNHTLTDSAFRDCSSLISVTLPSDLLHIEASAFRGVSEIPSIVLPEGLLTIGDYAFDSCSGLSTFVVPNSVTTMGLYMLQGANHLASLTVPFIGLDNLYLGFDSEYRLGTIFGYFVDLYYGLTYEADGYYIPTSLTTVIITNANEIRNYAFAYCLGIVTVVLNEGITSIGASAFMGTALTSITIPSTVQTIMNSAFNACYFLTTINFAKNASNLTSIATIGSLAFANSIRLKAINIPNSVTYVGDNAFLTCQQLSTVIIGNGLTNILLNTFRNCTNLTSVTLGTSVSSIADGAFANCTGLKYLYVNYLVVTTIVATAFTGATLSLFTNCPSSAQKPVGWGTFPAGVSIVYGAPLI